MSCSGSEVSSAKYNARGSCTAQLEKMPSKTNIMIGLEDEQGELKPVDIDEVDEVITMGKEDSHLTARRVSITEQVLKSKNTEQTLHGLQVQALSRKQQLVALLHEHEQIVRKVHRMESKEQLRTDLATSSLTSSLDKENIGVIMSSTDADHGVTSRPQQLVTSRTVDHVSR